MTKTLYIVAPEGTAPEELVDYLLYDDRQQAHTLAYDNGLTVFAAQVTLTPADITPDD